MSENRLATIDLFSGIGGVSLALKEYCTTVLYCEIDKLCQQILTDRMKDGQLDPAPIHANVSTLYLSPKLPIQMLTAGFPCQDISTIGMQQGIQEGTRSGLFYEIMRIVDSCPTIQVLFLENVENILKVGLTEVVNECTQRGFNLQWTVRSASALGAPHVRKRWFCLAVRGEIDLNHIVNGEDVATNFWESVPPPPVVSFRPSFKEDCDYDSQWAVRCATLGNSVVPQVVRQAFVELVKSHTKWPALTELLGETSIAIQELPVYQDSGLVYNGRLYNIPKTYIKHVSHSLTIAVPFGQSVSTFRHLPTPRKGNTHPANVTERSLHDLPTVLVHSTMASQFISEHGAILDKPTHQCVVPNVNFVEWMMGYGANWTKPSISNVATTKPVRNDSQDNVSESSEPSVIPSVSNQMKGLNGLHMFMRDHPNTSVKVAADHWKKLSDSEKESYKQRAKLERLRQSAS